MTDPLFNVGERVRILRPNLWADETGEVEARATAGKKVEYRIRADRGFSAPAKPEEIERLEP
jgi:hypothetical protein